MSNKSRILDIMEDSGLGRDADPESALHDLYNAMDHSNMSNGDFEYIDNRLLALFETIADHVAGN